MVNYKSHRLYYKSTWWPGLTLNGRLSFFCFPLQLMVINPSIFFLGSIVTSNMHFKRGKRMHLQWLKSYLYHNELYLKDLPLVHLPPVTFYSNCLNFSERIKVSFLLWPLVPYLFIHLINIQRVTTTSQTCFKQ